MRLLMNTAGIRILDKKNKIIAVELPEILSEIPENVIPHWSILYLEATGNLKNKKSIPEFEKQIMKSKKRLLTSINEMIELNSQLYDVMNILIIGCKDLKCLHRYPTNKKMYESCDIVIEMFDSSFWEVYSKDSELINKLAKKFKSTELIDSGSIKY